MVISHNSQVYMESGSLTTAVKKAIERMRRDICKAFYLSKEAGADIILRGGSQDEEEYIIYEENGNIIVEASEELGYIYGLFYISEMYLGIKPFWFFLDQEIDRKVSVDVENINVKSTPSPIRFRGWFINDEVLISRWKVQGSNEYVWDMAFEALLRCKGNMVIPGTDNNSRRNRELASDMGLYITHHHAEPLGAEMFSRAYSNLVPSYALYSHMYKQLWREAIEEQKNYKVIWNIGFRGQGDYPFWNNDPDYDTDEKRGELISSLIMEQYNMVKEHIDKPYFCTNLYGEVMELYRLGYIKLPDDIIKVWADNGYGAMVSRRQGDKNLRIEALPISDEEKSGRHGLYYHVSFYDLQAASHITMLPNSMEYVEKELNRAYNAGVRDFYIINSSNIRTHGYELDAIRHIWNGDNISDFSQVHSNDYYRGSKVAREYLNNYNCITPIYGSHEDEHAGEQLYTYFARTMASEWMKRSDTIKGYKWLTTDESMAAQVEYVENICAKKLPLITDMLNRWDNIKSDDINDKKINATVMLSYRLHYHGMKGIIYLAKAYREYEMAKENDTHHYMKCFYKIRQAADEFRMGNREMRDSEYGIYKDFYGNDCLADYKFSAYILERLASNIRNESDGPHFFYWQRELTYSEYDKKVMLITNYENHFTDDEIYEAMKKY